MKICVVTHSFLKGDGQGRVNYEVVLEAIRQGHSLTVVASNISDDLKKHKQVEYISIPVSNWPTGLLRNLVFSKKSASWLRLHKHKFDLVKVNGAITRVSADINAAHFVHSSWLKSPAHTFRVRRDLYGIYQGFFTAINAHWEKQAFRRTRVVVAVSEKIAEELLEIGVPPERIQVIVNGVDLEEFAPGVVDRCVLNLPKRVPLALFVGDIQTSRKNLDTVLKALVNVPNLHLIVVGSTDGSPYPKMAEQLGISQRVKFLGYRRDIPALMKAVDFFVFPSRYEPLGLVLLEAMASGLPVITTAVAGGAKLVTAESGIVLEAPNDIQALAQALLDLSSSSTKRRQRMGQAARTVAEQHSWKTMAEQYIKLFESL